MPTLTSLLPITWRPLLINEISSAYWKNLESFIEDAYATRTIYPPKEQIFSALSLTPPSKVSVVILGQDPYHGENQAHGLSFSVLPGTPLPPSLRNIFQEIKNDCGIDNQTYGCLTPWAQQGVLLLNAVLTVEKDLAGSHAKKGWETFTDALIGQLNLLPQPIIFLLWGGWAQKKQVLITSPQHQILTTSHPSPLSVYRGFTGCQHFSQVNRLLQQLGRPTIDWRTKIGE